MHVPIRILVSTMVFVWTGPDWSFHVIAFPAILVSVKNVIGLGYCRIKYNKNLLQYTMYYFGWIMYPGTDPVAATSPNEQCPRTWLPATLIRGQCSLRKVIVTLYVPGYEMLSKECWKISTSFSQLCL